MEGAKVYVPDTEDTWRRATVVAPLGDSKYRVQVQAWDDEKAGPIVEVDASGLEGGALPFQNANMPEIGYPDMTTLDHLHEPALLHNLRTRFSKSSCPYTYTADIVIAVNPYRWFPHLYTDEKRKEYLVFDKKALEPHAYAASSAAYAGLQETYADQSILVSGESGAGKTETVKILMAHLAFIASSEDTTHIKRIVESNPLLESFGNAQTVRNDNSSRFGKFIELEIGAGCKLIGSKCRTYLLEKSRVVTQDAGERNYHIFYQMLANDAAEREAYCLGDSQHTRDHMQYVCKGQSPTNTIEGQTDAERFKDTVSVLALVGVEGDLLASMLRALAAVLLLGQVEFIEAAEVASFSDEAADAVIKVASALDVSTEGLQRAMVNRTIRTKDEKILKTLSGSGAIATRDALAKELYSKIFEWLVQRICAATGAAAGSAKHFVGLLDIFGFESFAINRFEQLCINYANEKLQQKFTMDVFKAVQQEYSDEGIPWDRIEFKDNAPVLNLIESKLGIIALLNEEGVRPKGSEMNFVSKMCTVHKADAHFSTPRVGKLKELQFTVSHYAGAVTYTTTGWLERNKDAISDDITDLMRSSQNNLVATLFAEKATTAAASDAARTRPAADTVATKFKVSLAQLMETVGKTATQYVRCIKPNKIKSPTAMENTMVLEQLRCAGVIEAIRISRAGFPARMPLKDFAKRFGVIARAIAAGVKGARSLSPSVASRKIAAGAAVAVLDRKPLDDTGACRALVAVLLDDGGRYELGRTRLYFKHGVLDFLEEQRSVLLQAAATEIARRIRGNTAAARYRCLRKAALQLQSARRMYCQRRKYLSTRSLVVGMQARRRTVLAHRRAILIRRHRNALSIQCAWRRKVAVRQLANARCAAIRIQAAMRRKVARTQYLINLVEAREQAKLENQVKALQARLEAQEKQLQAQRLSGDVGDTESKAEIVSVVSAPSEEILEALQMLGAENAKLRMQLEKYKSECKVLRREVQDLKAGQSNRQSWLTSLLRSKESEKEYDERRSETASSVQGSAYAASDLPSPRRQLTPATRSSDVQAHAVGKVGSTGTADEDRDTESQDEGAAAVEEPAQVAAAAFYPPLSEFWEDVPCCELPLLRSGSEVHIKFGPNVLMVDEKSKRLVWQPWMPFAHGYHRTMAFVIERRQERRASLVRADEELIGCDTEAVGLVFALRSAFTGKYLLEGGMLDWYSMQVTGERPEDATVFTLVPALDSEVPGPGGSNMNLVSQHSFGLLHLGEHRMLTLRKDGYVALESFSEADSFTEERAASMEYLLPCISYQITVEEETIGVTVGKDLPLRVVGFKTVAQEDDALLGPGPAERTGRVHLGDQITSVNGEDVTGASRTDALRMIAASRPVTLGFSVGDGIA